MEYENRQPVEGINAPEGNPLKRFFALAISLLVFITLIYFALFFLGGWLAQRVSFATEARLVESMDINFSEFQGFDANDQSAMEIEQALNRLADKVITEMQIPEDMNVTVHYLDSDVFNAFATLGGHVFFSRGLLEQMPHENALAMVMAHEIAHVTERHPIKGFGGSVTSGVALAIVSSYAGSAGGFISSSSVLSGTSFSRSMETDADTLAISAVNEVYGHVAGADELFRLLQDQKGEKGAGWVEEFTSTHPHDEERILAIADMASKNGWLDKGDTTPLPEALANW